MYSCQKASRSLQTSQLARYLGNKTCLCSTKDQLSLTRNKHMRMPLLLRPKEQKNRSLIYAVASPVPSHLPDIELLFFAKIGTFFIFKPTFDKYFTQYCIRHFVYKTACRFCEPAIPTLHDEKKERPRILDSAPPGPNNN